MNIKKNVFFISCIVLIVLFLIISINISLKNENKIENDNISFANINSTNEKNDIILDLSYESDYILPENLNQSSSYIILGKVKSIDGGINYNPKEEIYTVPQTIGTLEVSKVIKGNITENTIPFIRVGGEISFEEYEKSLSENQKTKLELVRTLSENEKKEKYVSAYESEDIKLENGKEYLMYLCYDEDYNRYNIQYLHYGLREIKKNNTGISTLSTGEIQVKNNITGEYESLSEVIGNLNYDEK